MARLTWQQIYYWLEEQDEELLADDTLILFPQQAELRGFVSQFEVGGHPWTTEEEEFEDPMSCSYLTFTGSDDLLIAHVWVEGVLGRHGKTRCDRQREPAAGVSAYPFLAWRSVWDVLQAVKFFRDKAFERHAAIGLPPDFAEDNYIAHMIHTPEGAIAAMASLPLDI